MSTKFAKFVNSLKTKQKDTKSLSESFLTNEDLEPVKEEHRQWRGRSYVNFWISDSVNVNTLMIASSNVGLTWWQSLICVFVGYLITGIFIVGSSRPGAAFHIPFSAFIRSSFGVFNIWPVLNRIVMATIWFSVQSWIGGKAVRVLISSMATSHSYENAPGMSVDLDGGAIKGHEVVSFILFVLICLIPMWFPIHKLRHFFAFKAIVSPLSILIFFIWALVKANKNSTDNLRSTLTASSTLQGSEIGWAIIKGIISSISNAVTLIVNITDLASRARKVENVTWSQFLSVPLSFTVTSFLGIIIGTCYQSMTGKNEWDPIVILESFLGDYSSGAARFGVFVIAFGLIVAQIMTNIAANTVSFGVDSTALLPQFISIRRGSYLCAIIGLCLCPWRLTSGANSFTTYLSGYSVFLSAIVGVSLTDFYIIKRGRVRISDLYKSKDGWYSYLGGFNIRAIVAYLCGVAINLPGFIASTPGNENIVNIAATRIYNLSFFTGFIISSSVYIIICYIFPPPGKLPISEQYEEVDLSEYERAMNYFHQPIDDNEIGIQPNEHGGDYSKRSSTEKF